MNTVHPVKRKRHQGMTLVELLIGLAVTAMIGGLVATLMNAVAYGTQSERDLRRVNTRLHVLANRLAAATRASRMVLAKGTTDAGHLYIVLWMADTRANDKPNLSELRRIELAPDPESDTAGKILRACKVRADADLSASEDTAYELSADFDAQTRAARDAGDLPPRQWAGDVTGWMITLPTDDPTQARIVNYRLSITLGQVSDTLPISAALRNAPQSVSGGSDGDDSLDIAKGIPTP